MTMTTMMIDLLSLGLRALSAEDDRQKRKIIRGAYSCSETGKSVLD